MSFAAFIRFSNPTRHSIAAALLLALAMTPALSDEPREARETLPTQSVISAIALTPMAPDLIPAASTSLAKASADPAHRQACADLLINFSRLSEEEFKPALMGCEQAWENLLRAQQTRPAMVELAPVLLPRFAKMGNVFTFERLIRCANESEQNGKLINPQLLAQFEVPVPGIGLNESRQDYLLVSALRAGDLPRAKAYLAAIKWQPNAATDQIRIAQSWGKAFDLQLRLRARGDALAETQIVGALTEAIALFHRFNAFTQNRADKAYGKEFLAQAAAALMLESLDTKQSAAAFIGHTKNVQGAKAFWLASFPQLQSHSILEPKQLESLRPFYVTFGEVFDAPDHEFSAWLALAADPRIRGMHMPLELRYAHNALAAAANDLERLRAIQALATIYTNAGKFDDGRRDLQPTVSRVQAPELRSKVQELVNQLELLARDSAPVAPQSTGN